ncbi:MAG TPA: cytochrome c [Rhodanobacteraceae bacterium]|jgi:cytochrome c553
MQQRFLSISLFALAAVFASSAAFASGDAAAGKQKAQQVCAACHGLDGTHTADGQYPRLAGQYEDYIVQALHEYQAGNRTHPTIGALSRGNAIMQGMAAPLSDQDIDNVAAYYSSLPGTLSDLHGKVQGGN